MTQSQNNASLRGIMRSIGLNIGIRWSAYVFWLYIVAIVMMVFFFAAQILSSFVPIAFNPLTHVAVIGLGLELAFILLLVWESVNGLKSYWKRVWYRYTPPLPEEGTELPPLIIEGPYSKESVFGFHPSRHKLDQAEVQQNLRIAIKFIIYAGGIYFFLLLTAAVLGGITLALSQQFGLSLGSLTNLNLPSWLSNFIRFLAIPISLITDIADVLYPDAPPILGYFVVTLYTIISFVQTVAARNLIPVGEHINSLLYVKSSRMRKLVLVALFGILNTSLILFVVYTTFPQIV